jgi:hypothetical protein
MEVIAVTRRCIGLDVHRDFAQVAIWQPSAGPCRHWRRPPTRSMENPTYPRPTETVGGRDGNDKTAPRTYSESRQKVAAHDSTP